MHFLFDGLVNQVGGLEVMFFLIFHCHFNILVCFVLCVAVVVDLEGSLEFLLLSLLKLLVKDAGCSGDKTYTDILGKLVLFFFVIVVHFSIDSEFWQVYIVVEDLGHV